MSATSRRRAPPPPRKPYSSGSSCGVVLGGLGVLTATIHLAVALDHSTTKVPAHPVTLLGELVDGRLAWPRYATAVLATLLAAASALAVAVGMLCGACGTPAARVDQAAVHMGRGPELGALERRGAAASAQRLGVEARRV